METTRLGGGGHFVVDGNYKTGGGSIGNYKTLEGGGGDL